MWSAENLHIVLAAILSGVLICVAVGDIMDRRIPNAAVLAVVALFALWALADRGASLGTGLAAAAIGFGVGFVFYLMRIMGAGDVKLFAAVALFTGLGYLHLFALATVLAGGAMAVVALAARPRRALVMFTLKGRGDFGRGIPYGVAIAVGGLIAVWGGLTGALPVDVLNRI
ncbi:A24 family peptidase [Phenylobacterium sp. 58.2.17]|uniref:A24 family peptidase n=1 Tax=Phenylobacterium sp. 58.2.17 TaxID=2969306 RepID=UPI00226436CA|nr:prepilin peptidase [Phenylobacterium sp. 58.2.17]MCX7586396.1 prepilin peptidase [Phenylobacterium sp. 58.2.17]